MYIITGGGSGIGQALAITLAQRQQSVLIIGRRIEALQKTASQDERISYFQADISTESGRGDLCSFLQDCQQVSGLVHNAGVIEPIAPIQTLQLADFEQVLATNVAAPLCLNQLLLPKLTGGRVLHIGSGAAYFPVQGWAAYCTSKAALSMMTQCWKEECQDPAFTSVMPGIIDTPMQSVIRHSHHMAPDRVAFFQNLKDNQQLVSAETVALFLAWLLLDIERDLYSSKEWDIYDQSHHQHWLVPPHQVPSFEE